jgi:hypothetical protein
MSKARTLLRDPLEKRFLVESSGLHAAECSARAPRRG